MKADGFFLAILLVVLFMAVPIGTAGRNREYLVFAGTYTGGASKGIYAHRFDPSTGRTVSLGLAAETTNPSFLAVHPNRQFLYAVNEVSNYEGNSGYVSAFSIDLKTGQLTLLNKESSGGGSPCHLAIDRSAKWLMVANYGSGSVSLFPIEQDGKLGKPSMLIRHRGSSVDPRRQAGPHAHSVNLSPDNRFLLVSDLGLDKTMIYRLDADKGVLKANNPPFADLRPGSGPRHLSFHPNGRFVYQINELNSTLSVFAYDSAQGSLREIETLSTLPRGFSDASSTAEVEVHPSGRFVYGSNRGHDSIAVFAVKGRKGTLEPVEHVSTHGKTPRHFAIDPTGEYLFAANQNSGEVALFRIQRKTGRLSFAGTVLQIPTPVCVVFVPLL
jgi:6-phosphogluconolactonase